MDYPKKRKRKSKPTRISENLIISIDLFLETDIAKKAGYDDRKQVIDAAVRRLLEEYGYIETTTKTGE